MPNPGSPPSILSSFPQSLGVGANKSCSRPTPFTLDESTEPDFYAVLSLSRSATHAEIKTAYHRALLLYHPDKQIIQDRQRNAVDIDLLKKAFSTLSNPDLRVKYDLSKTSAPSGPRPAHVVSLEEFVEHEGDNPEDAYWSYECRCGSTYRITEHDMELGQHLVGCVSCSEVIWVGYELVEGDD